MESTMSSPTASVPKFAHVGCYTSKERNGIQKRTLFSADPSPSLLAAFAAWQKVYAHLADGFGIKSKGAPAWAPTKKAMLSAIDLEKLLAVERATVEKGKR
jgi:hypothetical protein